MHDENKQIQPDCDEAALGRRLREAREFLGLSQESVAATMNLPRATISTLEAGKRKVRGTELRRFADLYRRNIDYFFRAAPVQDDTLDSALFRATKGLKQSDKAQVLRFAEFLKTAGKPPKLDHD